MKQLLFILLLLAAFTSGKSQTIDTTIKSITAVKIQNVLVQSAWPKIDTCTHLGIRVTHEELTRSVELECILLANGKNIVVFKQVLEGEDYNTICDSANRITCYFQKVATKNNLVFKND